MSLIALKNNGLSEFEQIEQMAHNFSNFEENFDGERLPLTKGVFKFQIDNTGTSTQRFLIYSGYELELLSLNLLQNLSGGTSAFGQMMDDLFKGVQQPNFDLKGTCLNNGGTIGQWLAYVKRVKGNKVTRLIVTTTTIGNRTGQITVYKKDPINRLGDRIIDMSAHIDPKAFTQDRLVINDGFDLGAQDFIEMSIQAGSSMAIELHMNGYQTF